MSEFTKGKWEAGIDPIAVIPHVYVWTKLKQQKNKPAIIAVMHRCPYIKDKEQLANARLIAAAPDMYELLKEELIPTSDYGGIVSFEREKKIRTLLAQIDGEEAKHE